MNQSHLTHMQKHLQEEGAQMAFITSKENLFYLTGLRADPHERLMALFLFQDHFFFVVPKMEEALVRAAGYEGDLLTYQDHENVWDKISASIEKLDLGEHLSILIEERIVTYARVQALQALCASTSFADCEHVLMQRRLIKSDEELAILQEAAAFADAGIEFGAKALYTGITELEVVAEIEYELKKQGIREMSFQTTVLFGDHASSPHGKPGNRALKEGEFVLFDLGVVVGGYCSDITRTVAYGDVSEEQVHIYHTVLQAEEAAIEAVRPGFVIGDLDKTARSIIIDAGYGDYFPHRLGHGLGIDVHEFPSMSENNTDILLEGMTFTIEPGIYVPGVAGVRIEDDVVVTADGVESLTIFPKTLVTIPVRQMQ
ncbi:M24 family metallopeptidase [Bacillus sp. Marseille-P3800]|uniref:M24 family metallopeptidase n=1 Tax=Bacillus sp. Marseille-P3800 TaxID=2014782 RepID=UPI000C07A804|nr:Xaa-Pro peptidase family protein [Bacillus sp. Marseille-P3800]